MIELISLVAVGVAVGFCLGWAMRSALARAEKEYWFYDPLSHSELESGKWTNNAGGYMRAVAVKHLLAKQKEEIIDPTIAPPDFDRFPPTMILDPEEIVPLVEATKKYEDNVPGTFMA